MWFRLEKCDLYDANHWGNLSSFYRHTYVVSIWWSIDVKAENGSFFTGIFLDLLLTFSSDVKNKNVFSHEFGKMSSIEMGNFPHDIDRTLFDPWLIFMALFFLPLREVTVKYGIPNHHSYRIQRFYSTYIAVFCSK